MILIFIHVLNVLLPAAMSAPTVYDQRQSGNSNVKIDVKDVVLIAIADEFGDYDYSYDYSDLTIKPEVPSTTSKPESSTAASSTHPAEISSTQTTAVPSTTHTVPASAPSTTQQTVQNASVILENSTLTFVSNSGNETEPGRRSPTQEPPGNYQIPVVVVHDNKENTKLLPVMIVEKSASGVRRTNGTGEESQQPRNCSPGYFLDAHNRCKRIRKPLRENSGSRSVPALSV